MSAERHAYWQRALAPSGQYVMRLMGGNGEQVLGSETHPDKRDAMHVLDVVDEANGYPVRDEHGEEIPVIIHTFEEGE